MHWKIQRGQIGHDGFMTYIFDQKSQPLGQIQLSGFGYGHGMTFVKKRGHEHGKDTDFFLKYKNNIILLLT